MGCRRHAMKDKWFVLVALVMDALAWVLARTTCRWYQWHWWFEVGDRQRRRSCYWCLAILVRKP